MNPRSAVTLAFVEVDPAKPQVDSMSTLWRVRLMISVHLYLMRRNPEEGIDVLRSTWLSRGGRSLKSKVGHGDDAVWNFLLNLAYRQNT
jgi:hypothetical protein